MQSYIAVSEPQDYFKSFQKEKDKIFLLRYASLLTRSFSEIFQEEMAVWWLIYTETYHGLNFPDQWKQRVIYEKRKWEMARGKNTSNKRKDNNISRKEKCASQIWVITWGILAQLNTGRVAFNIMQRYIFFTLKHISSFKTISNIQIETESFQSSPKTCQILEYH